MNKNGDILFPPLIKNFKILNIDDHSIRKVSIFSNERFEDLLKISLIYTVDNLHISYTNYPPCMANVPPLST